MNYLQKLIKSLLIKAAGHKYIKRIPVGETKTGKVRYRYIYNVTHTVGGKHLLDDAHLQTGTKLMLHSKEGEEVHVHVESVDGDKVKVVFDDGKNKGEEKTYSKEKLLSLFNKEHGVQDKLDEKKKELQESIREGKNRGLSDKQINRLKARLNRLGGGEKEKKEERLSTLGKELLKKHSVTPEMLTEDFFYRGYPQRKHHKIDMAMSDRLAEIETHKATKMYNQMLEQSMKENNQVLTAIETIKKQESDIDEDVVERIQNARVNKMAEEIERKFGEIYATKMFKYGGLNYFGFRQFFIGQARSQLSRNSPNNNQIMKYIEARNKVEEVVDYFLEMCRKEGIPVKNDDFKLNNSWFLDLARVIPEEEKKANNIHVNYKLLDDALEVSCKDFLNNGEGNTTKKHPNHKVRTRNTRIKEDLVPLLNNVEEVFQKAYPERKKEQIDIKLTRKDRSFAKVGEIHLSKYASFKTAAHELTHTLEGRSFNRRASAYKRAIQDAVTCTHITRTKGNNRARYNGSKKEEYFKDEYHDVYAGKIYNAGSSELVTMGVQEFFNGYGKQQLKTLAEFAIRDPHHFLVTYGILKGHTDYDKH